MSKVVLFDFDGTLIDSAQTFANFLGYLCRRYDKNTVIRVGDKTYNVADLKELRAIFPEPHQKIYSMIGFDWSRYKSLIAQEHERYVSEKIPPLFNGVEDLINRLSRKYKLGIVTSNTRVITEKRLRAHNLESKFTAIICEEDVKNPKPSSEPLIKCLKKMGVSDEPVKYVGDLPIDIKTARAAGVEAIAVTWGLGTYTSLVNEKPDSIVRNVRMLEAILGL